MFAGLTNADLEAWRAFFACSFGMTVIIAPAVFSHYRREQTFKWRHKERLQELQFQRDMLEQPTAHLKFESSDDAD